MREGRSFPTSKIDSANFLEPRIALSNQSRRFPSRRCSSRNVPPPNSWASLKSRGAKSLQPKADPAPPAARIRLFACLLTMSSQYRTFRRPSLRSVNQCSPRKGSCRSSVPCFALLARRFKFVAGPPRGHFRLRCGFCSERESKARHLGQAGKIHIRAILITRLMIVMIDIVLRLRFAPGSVVALEFQTFVDGERRNADAGQAEMIRTVVMSRLRPRVGADRETKFVCGALHHGIKSGALGPAHFRFFRITDGRKAVVI